MSSAMCALIPQNHPWQKEQRPAENKQHTSSYSRDGNDISQCIMGENSGRENEQVFKSATWCQVKLRHTLKDQSSKYSHRLQVLVKLANSHSAQIEKYRVTSQQIIYHLETRLFLQPGIVSFKIKVLSSRLSKNCCSPIHP